MVRRRQARAIVGMALAVLGGIAWFYGQYAPAAILWGAAALIVFMQNNGKAPTKSRR
jgi:hypothetical protein